MPLRQRAQVQEMLLNVVLRPCLSLGRVFSIEDGLLSVFLQQPQNQEVDWFHPRQINSYKLHLV